MVRLLKNKICIMSKGFFSVKGLRRGLCLDLNRNLKLYISAISHLVYLTYFMSGCLYDLMLNVITWLSPSDSPCTVFCMMCHRHSSTNGMWKERQIQHIEREYEKFRYTQWVQRKFLMNPEKTVPTSPRYSNLQPRTRRIVLNPAKQPLCMTAI